LATTYQTAQAISDSAAHAKLHSKRADGNSVLTLRASSTSIEAEGAAPLA
jgi:hypothetical protein